MQKKATKKGFTLIELLIVIAIIAIIAAVAFVALDPLKRFQDARDAQRWADVTAILSAVKVDQIDNGGTYISEIDALTDDLYYQIGEEATAICDGDCDAVSEETTCVDLSGLATEGYLADVPIDPGESNADADETYYYLMKSSTGNITVGACAPEGGSAIEVAR